MSRVNEAYSALAYRRAIIKETIMYLRREFLGDDDEPSRRVVCEDMPQSECEVPQREVESFMEELIEQEADLRLELSKFEFVRRSDGEGETTQENRKGKHKGQGKKARPKGSRS